MSKLFEPAFLGKVSKKGDLISRLNELHVLLRDMPQLEATERPANFSKTAAQLISPRIMGNTDKDIRLLACCCIVDMFRISAPDILFSDEECVSIFEVFVAQLRNLSTCDPFAGNGIKVMYILHSLATVNTCVLPVILASSGVAGAEEVVLGLFHALISSIHAEHDEEVVKRMCSVLISCLEESEEISQELLDVLLLPLLPSSKADNVTAYGLVGRVLQGAPVNTQTSISMFLNHVLVGAPSGTKGRVTESELTDHIYPLIYEIHKLAPDLLLKVLPNVCTQLQAEEEDVRLKAVKLLGRLFASTYADYGTEFSRNFREFVGRFVDVSSAVRLEMVDCSALIIKRKAALREQVERPLRERLRDPDAEVRLGALQRMVELAQEDPLKLAVPSFLEMGARIKDRRPEVRKAALLGMAQVYAKHVASALPPLGELTDSGDDLLASQRGGLVDRLQQVPALVLSCWSLPEPAMKQQVLTLLQEHLLPRAPKLVAAASASQSQSQAAQSVQDAEMDGRRAAALYFMFAHLGEPERGLLSGLLQYKASVRKELQAFLQARDVVYGNARSVPVSSSADAAALKNAMLRLALALPTADKKTAGLERLGAMKDKNIFRLLARAAQPLDTAVDSLKGRDDLRGRVDSKSVLGEYTGRLWDTAGYLVANEDIVGALVRHAAAVRPEDGEPIAALLALLAKCVPRAFSASAEALEEWLGAQLGQGSKKKQTQAGLSFGSDVTPLLFSTLQRGAEGIADDEGCAALCQALLKLTTETGNEAVCAAAAEAASVLALFSEAKDLAADSAVSQGRQGRLSDSGMNEASNSVLKAMRAMVTSRQLDKSNAHLACNLRALASMLQYPLLGAANPCVKQAFSARVAATAAVRKAVRHFMQEQVLRAGKSVSTEGGTGLVMAGLQVWTAALIGEQEVQEQEHKQSDSGEEEEEGESSLASSIVRGGPLELRRLAECLWSCLDSEGATIGGLAVATSAERAQMFESAVSCALQLCRLSTFGKHITVPGWKRLAWSLLQRDEATQQRLAKQLFSIVQTSAVHLRFLVFPALLATEESLGYAATQSLLFNVRRLRRTHEVMSRRAQAEESDEMQRKAAANMPENILPYVLYLLSYHPDFPSDMSVESEDDRRKLRKIAALVRAVVRVLVDSLGVEENNIAFLLKQVNMVQAHYEDRHDKENIGLYFVTRLATKILSEMVRTDDNVQEYRGDVSLPMELYQLRADSVRPGERGPTGDFFHTVVRDGMQEAEAAMDRALGAGKKVGQPRQLPLGGTRKRASGGGTKAARKAKVVSPDSGARRDSDSESEEEEDETEGGKTAARKRSKPAAAAHKETVRVEGERKQPRRQSIASTISYRELGESEKEAEKWDQQAGASFFKPRKSSSLSKVTEDSDSSAAEEEEEVVPAEPSPKKKARGLAPHKGDNAPKVPAGKDKDKGGKQGSMSAFLRGPAGGEENAASAAAAKKQKRRAQ